MAKTLLETMHTHGNKDSLVYWLEFKNDEEFPARFGSIAGGSAFKFGIFRRKETGTWVTADEGNNAQDLTRIFHPPYGGQRISGRCCILGRQGGVPGSRRTRSP